MLATDATPAPASPQAVAEHAFALSRQGRFDEALALLRPLTARAEAAGHAHNWLGIVLSATGRHEEAEAAFRTATTLAPELAEAWANLGSALSVQGYGDAPLQAFSRALQLAPDNLDIAVRVGRELSQKGSLDLARRCFDTVLRHRPGDPDALAGLASLAERERRPEEARALLAPLVEAERLSPNAAHAWARCCLRTGEPWAAIKPVRRLLRKGVAPAARAHLLFALGDLLDRVERWEEAFAAYAEGNALQGLRWDPAAHTAEVDALLRTFSRASFQRRPRATGRGQRVVLVVGMPRSGTSLVEQVLATHPAVHGAGEREELRLASLALARHTGVAWPECADALTPTLAHDLGRWYAGRLGGGAAARVTDKMPANTLYLGLAAHLLPEARVVLCTRDPVDTCLSCYFQEFHHAHAWSTRLDWLAHRHREHDRLVAGWREVLPLPMLELRYEALVTDFEAQARRLVEFCGLGWDPACLRFHANRRFVGTASYGQVQQPIYTRSAGRWAHYRPWLLPLLEALGEPTG